MLLKAAGPLMPSARLAPWFRLLPPALFAALIVTQTFVRGREWTLDARAAGAIAAAGAVALRARPAVVLVIACATTAAVRMVWR